VIDAKRPSAVFSCAAGSGTHRLPGAYGVVGLGSFVGGVQFRPPVEPDKFVLMDFPQPTTFTAEEGKKRKTPTSFYAMDLGDACIPGRNLAAPGASRFTRMYCSGASAAAWRSGRGDRSESTTRTLPPPPCFR